VCFVQPYRDKKFISVFVRFRARFTEASAC
jgi:hypothetical protein